MAGATCRRCWLGGFSPRNELSRRPRKKTTHIDDCRKRRIHLHVSDAELTRRKAKWKPPEPHADRGWVKLYCETVTQADQGVDLDFLVGKSGAKVGRESH